MRDPLKWNILRTQIFYMFCYYNKISFRYMLNITCEIYKDYIDYNLRKNAIIYKCLLVIFKLIFLKIINFLYL